MAGGVCSGTEERSTGRTRRGGFALSGERRSEAAWMGGGASAARSHQRGIEGQLVGQLPGALQRDLHHTAPHGGISAASRGRAPRTKQACPSKQSALAWQPGAPLLHRGRTKGGPHLEDLVLVRHQVPLERLREQLLHTAASTCVTRGPHPTTKGLGCSTQAGSLPGGARDGVLARTHQLLLRLRQVL